MPIEYLGAFVLHKRRIFLKSRKVGAESFGVAAATESEEKKNEQ